MDNQFRETVQQRSYAELIKMVYQFDQWSPEMLQAVETELSKRNQLPADLAIKKQEAINHKEEILIRGKEASLSGQIFGWVFILGFLGLYIGYRYAYSKIKSKSTGKKYYRYNESSRTHGTYIFYAAIAGLILAVIYNVVTYV